MFKNLFQKSNKPKGKRADVIYKEYRAVIESKLSSLGFSIEENKHGLGSVTRYKRNELEVILEYDMRDPGAYFYARSGKKIPAQSRMDEIEKLIGKKSVNYEEVENKLIESNDISVALNGTDEEKNKLIQDLENWYLENS